MHLLATPSERIDFLLLSILLSTPTAHCLQTPAHHSVQLLSKLILPQDMQSILQDIAMTNSWSPAQPLLPGSPKGYDW
jgi:hypothetical protein